MTQILSPLIAQVFVGLTIANVAFQRFGAVFKKKKSEDKAEEVLHHERQNDDSHYDSEDLGESGGEFDLVEDLGFGKPKPIQRRTSSQMVEEDEMAYLEDDNKGWKDRNQVQKIPQENTQRGKKKAFGGRKA